jgi:hypothetical protein
MHRDSAALADTPLAVVAAGVVFLGLLVALRLLVLSVLLLADPACYFDAEEDQPHQHQQQQQHAHWVMPLV